jgi:hypothetical protein
MFSRIAAGLFALAVMFEAAPAQAQLPIDLISPPPAQTIREALDHAYGRALLAEFAKVVLQDGDPACLKEKTLDTAKLSERGRDMFERYGLKIANLMISNFDRPAFDAVMSARSSAGGTPEMARLQTDPVVQRYLSIERPMRYAKFLDFLFEMFDRYALITRIRIKSISPISTGNDALMNENPTEKAEEALEQFAASNPSPQLKRFLELSEIAADALNTSFNKRVALTWGPSTYYRGVETDLAEFCITRR